MATEDLNGWHDAPGGAEWACPECEVLSPIKRWAVAVLSDGVYTDEDARQCPACDAIVPATDGSTAIAVTTANALENWSRADWAELATRHARRHHLAGMSLRVTRSRRAQRRDRDGRSVFGYFRPSSEVSSIQLIRPHAARLTW